MPADLYAFPTERIVRSPVRLGPRIGDEVTARYKGEAEVHKGIILDIDREAHRTTYLVECEDGVRRKFEIRGAAS